MELQWPQAPKPHWGTCAGLCMSSVLGVMLVVPEMPPKCLTSGTSVLAGAALGAHWCCLLEEASLPCGKSRLALQVAVPAAYPQHQVLPAYCNLVCCPSERPLLAFPQCLYQLLHSVWVPSRTTQDEQ